MGWLLHLEHLFVVRVGLGGEEIREGDVGGAVAGAVVGEVIMVGLLGW